MAHSQLNGFDDDTEKKLYEEFLKVHSYQLITSGIPGIYWSTIFRKITLQEYDAGYYVKMILDNDENGKDYWYVISIRKDGISLDDPECIFIIDHAWTYTEDYAKESLRVCDDLLERMCKLMDIEYDLNEYPEILIDKVYHEMWKFNGTYTINMSGIGDVLPTWYVMDEVGSRIEHDGDPNCRTVPFFYQNFNRSYSLLFPVKPINYHEHLYRNYVEGPVVDEVTRDAQMMPWYYEDLTSISIVQEEPPIEFFNNQRQSDLLPVNDFLFVPLPKDRAIKVYTDYNIIRAHLTDARYEFVFSENEADIIWISTHFKDYRSLSETPIKRVNQFPGEGIVTVKDLLAIVSRRMSSDEKSPPWMIDTFCLHRELAKFTAKYQRNEAAKADNIWIVKPWNLARGIGHSITDNLFHILRLPATGPKIAQKYIHNPVLFRREDTNYHVKFDLRFIVLLLEVKPLKVAVYKNFWIRFANKRFELKDFDDYEIHFTVNNYNDSGLLQMFCHSFITKFEDQYPMHQWKTIEPKIYQMFKEVFQGAVKLDYPAGIANNPQCKASYGIDIMLDWHEEEDGTKSIQPKLLEVNFNPDCERACQYYPSFFNDLFNAMFLDEFNDTIEIL